VLKYLKFTGFIFIIFLIKYYDINQVLSILGSVNLILFMFALLLLFPTLMLKGIKSRILIERLGGKISMSEAMSIWIIGFYLGSFTPGKVGDFMRTLIVNQKTGLSLGQSFTTVFFERLMDLTLLLMLVLFSSLFFIPIDIFYYKTSHLAFVSLFFIAFIFLMIYRRLLLVDIIKYLISFFIPDRFKSKAENFSEDIFHSIFQFLHSKKFFLSFCILALSGWLLWFFQLYILSWCFDMPLSYWTITFIAPIILIVEIIPISILGVGTRDLALVLLLSSYDVEPELAISFSLGILSLNLLMATFGYFRLAIIR